MPRQLDSAEMMRGGVGVVDLAWISYLKIVVVREG